MRSTRTASLGPCRGWARAASLALTLGAAMTLTLVVGCGYERGKRFQHVSHAGAGLACTSCHEGVFKGLPKVRISSADVKDKKCVGCHKRPHPGKTYSGACVRCHSNATHDARQGVEPSHIIFEHARHEKVTRGQCFPCHKAVATHAAPFARLVPSMGTCLTCHQKDWDSMACGLCHERLDAFPLKPVAEFAHAGDFLKSHGKLGASRPELCAQCHTQPYCATCHDPARSKVKLDIRWPTDIEKGFIHRGDWVGRHAIEARATGDTCVRCHSQKECTGCHDRRTVGPGSQRNPHPAGWVSVTGGPNLHGLSARREIVACAGCHDNGAASNCVRCHKVGGVGGNPHPPGWKSRLSKTRDPVCRVCH